MAPRCRDCKFWDDSVESMMKPSKTGGACRINPPAVDKRNTLALWPITDESDWCGQFQPYQETMP